MMKPITIENYDRNYAAYEPQKEGLDHLAPLINGIAIIAVIGTWCADSKLYVPQFNKVLDALGFPENQLTLIEVDENKMAINASISHLNIKSVPTFIIYKQGEELGRIIESPQLSLEEDLLSIIDTPNLQ
ncbi:thioredoxin family protein [Pedobacter sp.]|uniref:thioredoxin family protein n=1 Tax=Pedobacter sp. TaxID=1411316 RepID=UPI003D7F99DB